MDPWTLPLTLQIGLATGYLAYVTAYASKRRHHTVVDATFMTFAFGAPAVVLQTVAPLPPLAFAVAAAAINLCFAVLWRMLGHRLWVALMRAGKVHYEDGLTDAWETVITTPGLKVGQVSVHTTDGRVLYLNDPDKYVDAPEGGLTFGTNGSVLMVVEEERMPDGTEQVREGISDPHWGTRMTYLPANQIVRINVRY